MNTIRFILISILISITITACKNGENTAEEDTALTEKQKCEKLVDRHADCLEQAMKSQTSQEDFEKCAENSLSSLEKDIQTETVKTKLKDVFTAGGLIPPAPEECAQINGTDYQFICTIRLEKQKTCPKAGGK